MTKHPYAEILRAMAESKEIQLRVSRGDWKIYNYDSILVAIAEKTYKPQDFRVKPETISINGHEVPKPLEFMPEEGTEVYWPSFSSYAYVDSLIEYTEVGYYPETLSHLLKNGLLHLTKEAAEAHALALISFTKKS